jgi:uncharacterized membrane protein
MTTETRIPDTSAALEGPLAAERIVEQTTALYRGGYILSFVFVGIGLLLAIIGDGELSTELGGPLEIRDHLFDLDPNGFIGFGIGVMILTPIVMSIEVAANFFLARDRRFAMISAAVSLILVVTMALAFV